MTRKQTHPLDEGCCLHPCPQSECPEALCAKEYPGGLKAYLRDMETKQVFSTGVNVQQAAKELSIQQRSVTRRYSKMMSR